MKSNTLAAAIGTIILIATIAGVLFTLSGGLSQQLDYPSDILTQEGTIQEISENYFFNVTVVDEKNIPIENTFVIVFEGTTARLYGYTNTTGQISFEMPPGMYQVQFERYKYSIETEIIYFEEDQELTQQMIFQEPAFFGIPSWAMMTVIGLFVLGLLYMNREYLKLSGWKKPKNFFGKTKAGKWTFIDKSTKKVLYGVALLLLVVLITFIVPNILALEKMAYYYIGLGTLAFILLMMEGSNKKFPIAAIGFGKKSELAGDIGLGISFAILFIGITGFISQLSFLSVSEINSLATLFMVVIVASFFEEAFHSGILAPTLAEKLGIVPAILFTSVVFMFGHGLAYGWVIIPLLMAFLFRVIATTIVLYKKSWTGVFFAHALINVLSVVTIVIFAGVH